MRAICPVPSPIYIFILVMNRTNYETTPYIIFHPRFSSVFLRQNIILRVLSSYAFDLCFFLH
jgi:hypothetical protein